MGRWPEITPLTYFSPSSQLPCRAIWQNSGLTAQVVADKMVRASTMSGILKLKVEATWYRA